MSKATLTAGAMAFFTMGVLQVVYGPLLPYVQSRYHLDVSSVGLIASSHFLGSSVAPIAAGAMLVRFSASTVASAGLILMSVGAVCMALAPVWLLSLLSALVAGFGLGCLSTALNTAYAHMGSRAVNLVNALFGVGAILSPVMVKFCLQYGGIQIPLLGIALLALIALAASRVWAFPEIPSQNQERASSSVLPLWMAGLVMATYVATESGLSAWGAKYLLDRDFADPNMALSIFWAGFTTSRFAAGILGSRLDPQKTVVLSVLAATLMFFMMQFGTPLAAVICLVLAGVAMGPVFGSLVVWMAKALPPRSLSYLFGMGSLGGALMPAILGTQASIFGVSTIPVGLAAAGASSLIISLWAKRLIK